MSDKCTHLQNVIDDLHKVIKEKTGDDKPTLRESIENLITQWRSARKAERKAVRRANWSD